MNTKFWNQRYYMAAAYTLAVIIITITYWKTFETTSSISIMPIIWPFIIGTSIAYILNFLLQQFEKKIKKRALSLTLTYVTIIAILAIFVGFLSPLISETMGRFIEDFPDFSMQIIDQIKSYLTGVGLTENHTTTIGDALEDLIEKFVRFNQNIIPSVIKHLEEIGQTLTHIVLGLVLSIYILAKKEMLARQFKKLTCAIFGKKCCSRLLFWVSRCHEIFKNYFAAIAITSLIVGVLTTAVLFIFRIPFAVLIGFIIAITNVIPIFGPLIGTIPSAIMIFFISPVKALIFVVVMVIIQQIDANIIVPKIVGNKIGIAPFWVLVSIIVFGNFAGIVGMIVGVPVTALILEFAREVVNNRLQRENGDNVLSTAVE